MSRLYECCSCCPDDDPVYHSENPPDSHTIPCITCENWAALGRFGPNSQLTEVTDERDRLREQVRTIQMVARLWVDAANSKAAPMSDDARRWSLEAGTAILEALKEDQ